MYKNALHTNIFSFKRETLKWHIESIKNNVGWRVQSKWIKWNSNRKNNTLTRELRCTKHSISPTLCSHYHKKVIIQVKNQYLGQTIPNNHVSYSLVFFLASFQLSHVNFSSFFLWATSSSFNISFLLNTPPSSPNHCASRREL